MNATPALYRFHAYGVSYFSSKVRPALRYKGLWVEERRANVREILRRTGKAAGSYTLWMVGRRLDAYRALSDADRARVDRELAGTGWDERLAHEPRHRFVKDGFRLAFA